MSSTLSTKISPSALKAIIIRPIKKSKKTDATNQQVSELARKINKYLTDEELALLRTGHQKKCSHLELKDYLNINIDLNPYIVCLKSEKQVTFVQKLAVRYLQPPKAPTPGPIIITVRKSKFMKPPPPIIIRQQPPRPITPETLILREKPPKNLEPKGIKVITIRGKRCPPPPRKLIIERLPTMPCKPASVIVERWLPYNQLKRKVLLTRQKPVDTIQSKCRNVIVQWTQPTVKIKQKIVNLGTIVADPVEYSRKYNIPFKHSVPVS